MAFARKCFGAARMYDWTKLLSVTSPGLRVPEENIALLEQELGFKLPASYRSFLQQLGCGLTCGRFMVFAPVEPGAFTRHSSAWSEANNIFADYVREDGGDFDFLGDDLTEDIFRRLVIFASSENNEQLGWDTSACENGEYRIYYIGYHFEFAKYSAENLYAFFAKSTTPLICETIAPGFLPLKPVFEGPANWIESPPFDGAAVKR
jgi:hypothetical protein